jgi:TRAP-type mannitol/chloroaromatic compound transport system permease small subunit
MSKNKNMRKGLQLIDLIGRLSEFGVYLAGLALMLMMFIGAADVIMDKLFNRPIPGTLEFSESLLVMSFFMAIGFTQLRRGHIAVELFTSRVKGTKKEFLDLISYLLLLVFFFLITFQGWKFALYSLKILEFQAGLINFPVYPAKLIAAFGLSIMTLQCFADLVNGIRKIIRRG